MPSDRSKNLRVWTTGAAIGLFVLGMFVIAYQIGYDRGENNVAGKTIVTATKGGATGVSGGAGKDAFVGTCGRCHTLAAAATSGAIGPNLDNLKPDKTRVLNAIQKGGIGSGMMPKGLFKGSQADQVAAFVAGAAGP